MGGYYNYFSSEVGRNTKRLKKNLKLTGLEADVLRDFEQESKGTVVRLVR